MTMIPIVHEKIEIDDILRTDRCFAEAVRGFAHCNVPNRWHGGLLRYVCAGVAPGEFLQAVLSNDLRESFGRADDEAVNDIRTLCRFAYNYIPSNAQGSREKVKRWAEAKQEEHARRRARAAIVQDQVL